jgi:hypothetical protein
MGGNDALAHAFHLLPRKERGIFESRLEIQLDLPGVELLSGRKASCSLEEHQDLLQLKAGR